MCGLEDNAKLKCVVELGLEWRRGIFQRACAGSYFLMTQDKKQVMAG
jgi:hypothetical protein